MPAPVAADLATFLGPSADVDSDQATAVIAAVTSMANAYTRGVGFTDGVPNSDISTVILTASARLLSHSAQVQTYQVQGPETASFGAAPFTWSTAELFVLNRYRVRAQ